MPDDLICAYCGQPNLNSDEEPEHIVPAAINGRYTTTTVCNQCNRWAGKAVNQPWLADPFVLDQRFWARVPDRRGNLVTSSPLLTGMTGDGRRITLGPDGKAILLNSPAARTDLEVRIVAADQAAMDVAMERERRKAERAGKTLTPGEQRTGEDQPSIEGKVQIVPGRWERIGAKMALGFLADTQPAAWRLGRSARLLRDCMRGPDRPVSEVRLHPVASAAAFAAKPATAIFTTAYKGQPTAIVCLMGIFSVALLLEHDSAGIDVAMVSDPLDPSRSCHGPLGAVIALRNDDQDAT